MATGWNDIDISGPLEREASACAIFSSLLALFMEEDKGASVVVTVPMICLMGFYGNDRVIRSRDMPLVMSLLQLYVDSDNDEFCLGHLIALMLLGFGGNKKSLFQHMDMPIIPDVRVDLNSMSQSDCRSAFRFDQDEMKRTVSLLPFPDIIITQKRDRVHLLEAYAIFCRRLSYPNRWCDLHKEF